MVEYYGKHGQGTHSTKMSADSSAEKNPKCPKIYPHKLSAQAQKFSMKKGFIGVHSPCIVDWKFVPLENLISKS